MSGVGPTFALHLAVMHTRWLWSIWLLVSAVVWSGCTAEVSPSPVLAVVVDADAGATGCPSGFHDCQGTCADDTSPATCGTSCTPCLVGKWAEPRCDGHACRLTCLHFHADCDHDPRNGCEAALLTDANNCGMCGGGCDGGTCNDGTCGTGALSPMR